MITGFEPFGGESINPSWEAVSQITSPKHVQLIRLKVPTSFYIAPIELIELIKENQPDYVLMIGQSGNTKSILLERVAINIDDARIADNLGQKPMDSPIIEDGPSAYFSSLPIKELKTFLLKHHCDVEISNSAGTYVCNHLMYHILHFLSEHKNVATKAGFIHVPRIETQVSNPPNGPFMPLKDIVFCLEQTIAYLSS
jgi:pyroglutamyl-peptidase